MLETNDIAIIGDTGFIGSSLKKVIKTKYNYNSSNINLYDSNVCSEIDKNIEKIVFLAGDPKIYFYKDKPDLCLNNNFDIIKNILLKDYNHFIFLSTVSVYKDISNYSKFKNVGWNNVSTFYGISKLLAEYEVKSRIKNYCILRLSTPFGNGMKKGPLFDLIKMKESYVSLDSQYSFLHLNDIANAISHVIKNRITGCFNLTANNSIDLKSLINKRKDIKIISNKVVNYDSDNTSLVETGWCQKIDVKDWIFNNSLL
jgi:nucleoside-diphosphate-sugar epimerase